MEEDFCRLISVLCLLLSDFCVPRRSSESEDGSSVLCPLTSVLCLRTFGRVVRDGGCGNALFMQAVSSKLGVQSLWIMSNLLVRDKRIWT
jgi:hypothetical protein